MIVYNYRVYYVLSRGGGMAKKKSVKRRRKHSFILTVCIISLAIVFVISLISIKKEIDSGKEEVKQLQSKCDEENEANKELQRVVDSGDKDEYIEKIAREQYGYIKPGDRVYKDIASGE